MDRRWPVLLLLAVGILCGKAPAATAMDFICIESSRYGQLAQRLGGGMHALTDALGIPADKPPPADACRAAYAEGATNSGDWERLAAIIAANEGWLDTLYLNSGGGDVGSAIRSAFVVRDFWLRTRVLPDTNRFDYGPAFLADTGADARVAPIAVPATATVTPRHAWCASACTFLLAAGADRRGVALVHRCGVGGTDIQTINGAVGSCLASMRKLYDTMGTGDTFTAAPMATPKQTIEPQTMPRFPPPVEDALLERCKSDAAQLDDLSNLLEFALGTRPASGLVDLAGLQTTFSAVKDRQQKVELCITRIREQDRRVAYSKLCAPGCTDRSLNPILSGQVKALRP